MKIDIAELWSAEEQLLLDVRTPAEFAQGHIPGAVNFPLFTDEERVAVGTLYKKVSPQEALLKGLEKVGPKMSGFVREAMSLADGKRIVLHCWRGGKRSESMGWLLGLAGLPVATIKGGYKAYRSFILKAFQDQILKMRILGGKTGSGKTEILIALREKGAQVIDLEALAHHKGSAFGALGETPQPSVEQFENNLYEVFRQTKHNEPVWVENENRLIGKVFLPEGFWKQMKMAPLFQLERSLAQRKAIILAQYGDYPIAAIQQSFEKIKKRLGGQNMQLATAALERNDLAEAIEIALYYYDKAYQYYLDKNTAPSIQKLKVGAADNAQIADQLIQLSKAIKQEPERHS